jgi:beta-lactamase superfamily II metal-dependent hydrolase
MQAQGRSENERSLVIEVEAGSKRVLIPNDVESAEQGRLLAEAGFFRKTDIFVAPHHSWPNAVNREVWKTIAPAVALVSCGERKNLPSAAFREAASENGSMVLDTALSGALHASFGPGGITAEPAAR